MLRLGGAWEGGHSAGAPNHMKLQVLVAFTAPNAINYRFGGIHGPEPNKSTGVGGLHGPKPHKLIGFGGLHCPEAYKSQVLVASTAPGFIN